MILSTKVLASIFADANTFCGKEDVIHAIIYRQLIESGLSPLQISREQAVTSTRIDIAVFDKSINGKFYKTSLLPKLVIEVKGGAYGDRNALNDEIGPDGYCKDLPKLQKETKAGIEAWFICIDMPELGRAIDKSLLHKIQEQCKERGISFAYYCQGENKFYLYPFGHNPSNESVPLKTIQKNNAAIDIAPIFSTKNPCFQAMSEQLLCIDGHEANTTAAVYQLLRKSGFSAPQVSLETYFSFAKKPGSSMHNRPDLVVFDNQFDGKFNLYKGGNRSNSNDAHKLKHIDSIFEVKGSASINKKGDTARLKIYLDDIEKLKQWQSLANAQGCSTLKAYFLSLDGRKKGLPQDAIDQLISSSGNNHLVYISNTAIVAT